MLDRSSKSCKMLLILGIDLIMHDLIDDKKRRNHLVDNHATGRPELYAYDICLLGLQKDNIQTNVTDLTAYRICAKNESLER
jgi:hypothetical protein